MLHFWQRNFLLFVVFITGAVVLIVEVTATRILSPYFGNTIYTFSSVIGIILAALSLGYYLGGVFADKHPKLSWFFGIILAGGLSILGLRVLNDTLLPFLGVKLSITTGPLVSTLALFFIPGFLLGTLSPFAIKLRQVSLPKVGVGKIAGEVFFWSTMGSILGSLSAGFFLIPRFGIDQIITYVGAALILMGLAGLYRPHRKGSFLLVAAITLLAFFPLAAKDFAAGSRQDVVYSADGVYEKITIYDGTYNDQKTRFLKQDVSYSAAMFLDSDELVYDYTKYYSIYPIFKPEIKEVLAIGGGAYSVPKAILGENSKVNVDVAEIEPGLFELAKKYFRVPDEPRLKNYIQDGRRFLQATQKRYDLIFSDVYYSLLSVPVHFTTEEFFRLAKSRLSEDGVFIANLIGSLSRQKPSFILSEIRTLRSAFPNSYIFAVSSPTSLAVQNIIFVGYNSQRKIDFASLESKEGDSKIIRDLSEKLVDLTRYNLSAYPKLTDNYAPVEYLMTGVLDKAFARNQRVPDGEEMMALISQQLGYGPRYLSAPGHEKMQKFLIAEASALAHETFVQRWDYKQQDKSYVKLANIVASFYPQNQRRVIIATHYDSKKFAEFDRRRPNDPVPGANDSASGVAVLLELARFFVSTGKPPPVGVDIIFFDGEEGEDILRDYFSWQPLGSSYFTDNLEEVYTRRPESGVVVDMVCDKDLGINIEKSSAQKAPAQVNKFWKATRQLYSDAFSPKVGPVIRDDHTPLNKAGIPTFLIIDFNYSFFHTTSDTLDKCSPQSLEIIADSLLNYIYSL